MEGAGVAYMLRNRDPKTNKMRCALRARAGSTPSDDVEKKKSVVWGFAANCKYERGSACQRRIRAAAVGPCPGVAALDPPGSLPVRGADAGMVGAQGGVFSGNYRQHRHVLRVPPGRPGSLRAPSPGGHRRLHVHGEATPHRVLPRRRRAHLPPGYPTAAAGRGPSVGSGVVALISPRARGQPVREGAPAVVAREPLI